MKKLKKIKLDKKDQMRAILTDTSPSDVPIIFSNDGLYINHHKAMRIKNNNFDILASLYFNLISPSENKGEVKAERLKKQNQQSFPMKYKIIKNKNSLRTLSLIHPRSQKNYCDIYRDYADAITYLCSIGSFSIRRPCKIGSTYYDKDDEPTNKYKEINIETLEDDLKRKHASSFFSYEGVDRLYKFFGSTRYFDLEKKFSQMWFLDVANCFDTIYTHTISWAVKNKKFIKKYVGSSNQFCQRIDTVMQRSNNNETNGVPVGAEFSRVFAEIIFQDIDHRIEGALKDKHKLTHGEDYEVVRYVDDYVIFSRSEDISKKIFDSIEDNLSSYNLYISESKIEKYGRPFFTYKSKVVIGVNEAVSELEESLFSSNSINNNKKLIPKTIIRKEKFEQKFINKIKKMISNKGEGYSEASPYLIGVLYNRALQLLESYNFYSDEEKKDKDIGIRIRDAFLILLRIIFFFYSVSPSVSSSEKVSKSIVLIEQFFKSNLPRHLPAFKTSVMSNVESLKFDREKNDDRNGYISLERLNIIIATSGFGENYTITKNKLSFSNAPPEDVTYFDIICLLYYFKNNADYIDERDKIIDFSVKRIHAAGFELEKNAESIYLFLDLLSCPFVKNKNKKELIVNYLKKYEKGLDITSVNLDNLVEQLANTYWFVKWKEVDLIKALERKELKRPY